MTDLAIITRIYQGSDGDATKMLYADLDRMGPAGVIATNLFRACKCSERAKLYRPGRGYRTEAYRRKDWSIKNLAHTMWFQDDQNALTFGWAIDESLRERSDPHHHILYVDLPTGQVSFHTGSRGEGPDYAGAWDGATGKAAERICRYVAELFKIEVTV